MCRLLDFQPLVFLALLAGCHADEQTPRVTGKVVSHVDTYGSGTGLSP